MISSTLFRPISVSLLVSISLLLMGFGMLKANAQTCTNLFPSGSQVPAGYGASYDLFGTAKALLLSGSCSGTNVNVTMGSNAENQYVFNQGHFWDGTKWQVISLTGTSPSGNWLARSATGTFPKGNLNPAVFVGYVCQYVENAWKCGCSNVACATPSWQVQGVSLSQTVSPTPTPANEGTFNGTGPSAARRAGAKAGVSYWTVPNSPNGMKPTMTWGGAGTSPQGEVYVGGMDHRTNSALYRLSNDRLFYVGDAKAASQAANNWKTGEVAEKFHTRPTWLNGNMFVATMNTSELNNAYLNVRGFHWYGYEIAQNKFTDLSAADPGGVGAEHGSIVALAADPQRNVLYGVMHPTGDLYAYFPAQKKTQKLGRPGYGGRALVYPGRAMWVDNSTGRLYFTAGNDAISYYGGSYDPAIFNHVYYYDPQIGFGEMKDWTLKNQRAIDASQCQNGVCYLMDNKGHIFRFSESGPAFTYLGQVASLPASSTTEITWVFSVDFARQVAYVVVSAPGTLYEFDLKSGTSKSLGSIKTNEPELQKYSVLYGHNAWSNGKFYFAGLNNTDSNLNMILVGIDPSAYKQAIGK